MQVLDRFIDFLIWLILILVILASLIPSLSSWFRKNVTGSDEREKFDLDSLISNKRHLLELAKAENTSSIERQLQALNDPRITALLKEFHWGGTESWPYFVQEWHAYLEEKGKPPQHERQLRQAFMESLQEQQKIEFNSYQDFCHFVFQKSLK